ncbi:hypothetical protein AB0C81_22985 [Streptomyces roseoverticillatus]|uniref:hypothetical protein n=1 Tax=Streptomyces roseoverticillatus TaxID=66429 RepID=UPI0033F1B10F
MAWATTRAGSGRHAYVRSGTRRGGIPARPGERCNTGLARAHTPLRDAGSNVALPHTAMP